MREDLSLRMHWHIPLKKHWVRYRNTFDKGIPVVEKESELLVCLVAFRRNQPYTLARARAIVRANNDAVNAFRKGRSEKTNS